MHPPAHPDDPTTPTRVVASHNQQRIWYAYQLTVADGEYLLPFAAELRGPLDQEALQRALEALLARHPILRTTYALEGSLLMQQIHASLPITLNLLDATTWSVDRRTQHMQEAVRRPFDLAQESSLRALLVHVAPQQHILILVFHHIAVDTVAIGILIADLAALYEAERTAQPLLPPPQGLPYHEFATWQATMLAGARGQRMRDYWRTQLQGDLPPLRLPTDAPYPPLQRYTGHAHGFALDPALITRLTTLGGRDLTLYTIFVTAFCILLARLSGQEEILIGTPISNRTRDALLESVGDFSDVVVLRARLTPSMTVADLLAHLQRTAREALFAADYPLDLLLGDLSYPRDPRRSPVYQVLFNMPQANHPALHRIAPFLIPYPEPVVREFGNLQAHPCYLGVLEAPVELSLDIWQPDGYYGVFKANRALFHPSTLVRLATQYQTLIAAMAADPNQRIADLPLTNDPEAQSATLLPHERTYWSATGALHLDRLEATLLATPQVVDCWSRVRHTASALPELAIYLVLDAPLAYDQLRTQIAPLVPPGWDAITVTPLSHIPLTATGQVDEQALERTHHQP